LPHGGLWSDSSEYHLAVRAQVSEGTQCKGDFQDEFGAELLTLTMALQTLEGVAAKDPYDVSLRAATSTLRMRFADLAALRDATEKVLYDCFDARMYTLATIDGPLADYMRGLYAWAKAIARAFEDLARELQRLAPDWSQLRARLAEAEAFYLEPLESDVRAQVHYLYARSPELADARDPLFELRAHVEEMFWSASGLRESLNERFG
jgi:hypothetical protein